MQSLHHTAAFAIRFAGQDDREAVNRLAQLDSRRAPTGEVLIGTFAGTPVAALSVSNGDVVADPFRPTADAVALLRARARQLQSAVSPRARRARLRLAA